MKVIHITVSIDRGGSENHLVSLIEQQVAYGYLVGVVFFKGSPYWKEHLETLGVKIYNFSLLTSFFSVSRLLYSFKPDVLHAHLQTAEIIGRVSLVFFPRIKFIISKHNDEDSRFIHSVIHKPFYSFISKRSSNVIAISKNVRNYCLNNLGIKEEKIEVIYYGINPSIYQEAKTNTSEISKLKNQFKIESCDKVIGSIARLHPQKSLDTLLKSFAILLNGFESKEFKLIIVGEGHLMKELQDLAEKLNISSNVIFTGKRQDIPLLLQLFDVFVLCSIYEGLGLVLLEAMSAEVPIIGTKAGAIPEIVGETGVLVEPRDVKVLAEELKFILEDDVLREKLSTAALKKIYDNFSLQQMFINTHNLYLN